MHSVCRIAIVALSLSVSSPSWALNFSMCRTIMDFGVDRNLGQFPEHDIELGICMTAKQVIKAIATDDQVLLGYCGSATYHLMAELKRRHPEYAANRPNKCGD